MPKRVRDYQDFLNEQLRDPAFASDYLSATALESFEMLPVAMRKVAEAHKMSRVANGAKVNRESLYKTLSANGNPRLDTMAGILDVFGIQLAFLPKSRRQANSRRVGKTKSTASSVRARRKPR
jgi:probable addiction module antidote protein